MRRFGAAFRNTRSSVVDLLRQNWVSLLEKIQVKARPKPGKKHPGRRR